MKRLPPILKWTTQGWRYVCFALVLALVVFQTPADAGQAKIIRTDGKTATINAGVDRGVRVGMLAEIYMQTPNLIHPVTGEDLGSQKVKIARITITSVGAVTAEGKFSESYAPVNAGDIVESIEVAPTSEDQIRASVSETRMEMRELVRSLASEIRTNEKAIEDLRATLRRIGSSEARLRSIANDVRNMRERMVIMDRRVTELEDNQKAIIMRDTMEVDTGLPEDMTELSVLRRGDDESIYLQIGSRTYMLSFEQNALIPQAPGATMGEGDPMLPLGEAGAAQDLMSLPPEEEEVPWYEAYWWVGALVGVLGALVVVLLRFLKRPAADGDDDEEAPADDSMEAGFPEAEVDEDFPVEELGDEILDGEELEVETEET